MTSHLFIKAVQLLAKQGIISGQVNPDYGRTDVEELTWRIRGAFFKEAQDIGRLPVLGAIADEMGLPTNKIEALINSGEAFAALSEDMDQKATHQLEGSPTYMLNNGRQKLYGNVGFKVLEANIVELLNERDNQASWC